MADRVLVSQWCAREDHTTCEGGRLAERETRTAVFYEPAPCGCPCHSSGPLAPMESIAGVGGAGA